MSHCLSLPVLAMPTCQPAPLSCQAVVTVGLLTVASHSLKWCLLIFVHLSVVCGVDYNVSACAVPKALAMVLTVGCTQEALCR